MEFIVAIALWCSIPVNPTLNALKMKTGSERSVSDVQACRSRLFSCLKNKDKFLTGYFKTNMKSFDCFEAEKLN